jgi:quinol monooxygenase YgiN
MYGLIGKMSAAPGKRDELADAMLAGVQSMPGCISYVIATDPADPDALWITEVWDRQESHAASLQLPSVKAAIAKGRPLIAGFSNRVETMPIGGHGLAR